MSNQTAILLVAFVAGVPIALIGFFVIRQLWKDFNWKSKIGEGLLTFGVIFLVLCVIECCTTRSPQDFSGEKLVEVHGTVQAVTIEWESYGNIFRSRPYYVVQIDGDSYTLWGERSHFWHFSDFRPDRWAEEAVGQTVELTVSRYVEVTTSDDFSGTIYGIRDAEGNVILDAKAHREKAYAFVKKNAVEIRILTAVGILMIAAGIYIKCKLKW